MSPTDSSHDDKTAVPRKSDARKVAQMRETGVTPSVFRYALRSHQNRRPVTNLPDNPPKTVATTNPAVKIKTERVTPEPATQRVSIDRLKAIKSEEEQRPVKKNPPEPRVSEANKELAIDEEELDLAAILIAQQNPPDRRQSLNEFRPGQMLSDGTVDTILESFAARDPLFGRVGSFDIIAV
nr:uncharacterized protein CTRU02_15123 [Colletotrichum truncatum]KAF6781416.1 hypothetical protein CTRU02_15123 [Colletotrichum truncatum]